MNIVILSRNINLYSTRRLIEEAENRNHHVEVIDPLECDLIIEKEKPTILYRDSYLEDIDAIIPRIGHLLLAPLQSRGFPLYLLRRMAAWRTGRQRLREDHLRVQALPFWRCRPGHPLDVGEREPAKEAYSHLRGRVP